MAEATMIPNKMEPTMVPNDSTANPIPSWKMHEASLAGMLGKNWEDLVIPRRISPPRGYPSPKHWWMQHSLKKIYYQMWDLSNVGDTPRNDHTEERERDLRMFLLTGHRLCELDSPTFFLSDTLLDALERTDIEKTMPMEEMMWPHESMMFVLPTSRRFAEITGVKDFPSHIITFTITRVDHVEHGKSYIVTSVDHEGATCYSHYPCKGTYSEQIEEHGDKFVLDCPKQFYREEMGIEVTPERMEADRMQINEVTRLAWKVLCAMNAPNETVMVGGGVAREARVKGGRTRSALWRPIMLDLSDRPVHSDSSNGSDTGVRLHWRRGHFRRQVCGAGRAERKILWIKPHRVGSL